MKVIPVSKLSVFALAGGGPGAPSGGQEPGAKRHLHDGYGEGQVGPLRSAPGGQLAVQDQDHQGEPQPTLD